MEKTLKKIGFAIAFNIGALYVTIEILEGVDYTGGLVFFLVAGALMGLLNTFLKPILKFVTFPAIFFSAGLFLIVINAAMIWITDELLEIMDFTNIDFKIEGIVNYVLAAIIFGLVNWFEHWFLKRSI